MSWRIKHPEFLLNFLGLTLSPCGVLVFTPSTASGAMLDPRPLLEDTGFSGFWSLLLLATGGVLLVAGCGLARSWHHRKRVRQERARQRQAQLERLAALGNRMAGLAHEARNPLTGIDLLLDELQTRLSAQPHEQDLLRRALRETARLKGLVDEVLHEAALPKPLLPGELLPLLGELLVLIAPQCRRAGVTLETELPERLPAIRLDSSKFKQALLNLLGNALEAMPRGGRLRVAVRTRLDEVRITLDDNGEGIPAERLERIFEPFYTTKGEGTGLGLPISRDIVLDHGGRIEVVSQVGVGTTVTVSLPCAADRALERGLP